MYNKLKPLLLSAILLSFPFISVAQTGNVLLIIADDLGIDAIRGYGIQGMKPNTPHIDSLRTNGLTFTNAWSAPVCTPTRAGIMSGKYGIKTGVLKAPGHLDTTHTSLPKALKAHNPNHQTAVIGKWHIALPISSQHPVDHQVDHYMGILGAGWPSYNNWDKTANGTTATSTDYMTSAFTDGAINWLNSRQNNWLLWLAHVAPHTPIHVPPAHMHTRMSTNSNLKKYMAMIESLDFEIGRLLDAMPQTQKDSTTIIFIGDNGTPNSLLQQYPAKHGKQSLYEGGIRIPFFVSGYGVNRKGQTDSSLINTTDLYATILELNGLSLPGGIYNSRSFKHLLNTAGHTQNYNYSEYDNGTDSISGYTCRNARYKIIVLDNLDTLMYDLQNDPLETNNLHTPTLSSSLSNVKNELLQEAAVRRNNWSCNDGIKNGNEQEIDCGGSYCSPCIVSNYQQLNQPYTIKVYPNPANKTIQIRTNRPMLKLFLANIQGSTIIDTQVQHNMQTPLNIEHLPAGIYYLKVLTDKGWLNTKIIKQF